MFEFALMAALVYTKLMGTVQTTVTEYVVRPYFFSTRDQNGTLDQKYTGTAYHYDTLRTTRCVVRTYDVPDRYDAVPDRYGAVPGWYAGSEI
jgi:hypothetical protein